jgi:hypothetical protein
MTVPAVLNLATMKEDAGCMRLILEFMFKRVNGIRAIEL